MQLGIDQLHISSLRSPGTTPPSPDMQLIDRARLYGLQTLPAIKARQSVAGSYEILSGVVTWRVAQMLRIDDLEVECLDIDNGAAREMVCADMGEGGDLDPITRAEILRDHIEVEGLSRNTLCHRYGLSRSQLSHCLRLLQLAPEVREWVRAGRLSAGKAKVLVKLVPRGQRHIAQLAIDDSLSTRQVEGVVRNTKSAHAAVPPASKHSANDSNTRQLATELSEQLGNPVTIQWDAASSTGELSIRYFSLEELETIIERLQHKRESHVRSGISE